MLGPPAMYGMPSAAYTVDGQSSFTTLASSSAAHHPQPSPYHQGYGGGGLPGVLDGGFTAQEAANSQNMIPGELPAKRKRGRPKKYGPNSQPTASMSFSGVSNAAPSKKRGRPLGSGKKQQTNAPGSSRMKLHVHFITVPAGEDVVSKIVSLFQQGSHCILSASGVVSEVKLFQPAATGGGIVGYQGLFEILSLSGTFLLLPFQDNSTEQQRQVSGLTISLANSIDGCVLGGGLAGLLLAASPVQVVVGSFIPEVVPSLNLVSGAIANTSNYLPSRDALSESSSDYLRSLPMQNAGSFNYINSLGL